MYEEVYQKNGTCIFSWGTCMCSCASDGSGGKKMITVIQRTNGRRFMESSIILTLVDT